MPTVSVTPQPAQLGLIGLGVMGENLATLLLDALRGDGTLFTRRDEVEAAWRIIAPIEEAAKREPAVRRRGP